MPITDFQWRSIYCAYVDLRNIIDIHATFIARTNCKLHAGNSDSVTAERGNERVSPYVLHAYNKKSLATLQNNLDQAAARQRQI